MKFKFNHSFVIVIFIHINSISSSYGFYECFSSDTKTLDLICGDAPKVNCTEFDRSNVKILKYQCNPTVLVENVITNLTNLCVIDVSSLQITSFNVPVGAYENIKVFNASQNQLPEIPHMIFEKMPNISEIDLSWNEIQNILSKKIAGADQVSIMNISHNNINCLDALDALKNLEKLDLSHNNIKYIGDDVFRKNEKLKLLDLRHNNITNFSFRIFSPNATEIVVHLPSKHIEKLDIGCSQTHCHFKKFEDDDNFETIKTFQAEGNKINNFSILFEKLGQSLETLNLTRCFIGTISSNMLKKFPSLTHITMTNTNITSIEANSFSYHSGLILLDLSHNKLTEVDSTLFSRPFSDLQMIYLEDNSLTRVDNITLEKLPKLHSLSITKNNFTCDYLTKYLAQWKKEFNIGTNETGAKFTNVRRIDCCDSCAQTPAPVSPANSIELMEKEIQQLPKWVRFLIVGFLIIIAILLCIICFGLVKFKSKRSENEVEVTSNYTHKTETLSCDVISNSNLSNHQHKIEIPINNLGQDQNNLVRYNAMPQFDSLIDSHKTEIPGNNQEQDQKQAKNDESGYVFMQPLNQPRNNHLYDVL